MSLPIKVPAVGESVKEALIADWRFKDGDFVKLDDVLVELETDKATVEIVAESQGVLSIKKIKGTQVVVGEVIGELDASQAQPAAKTTSAPSPKAPDQPPVSAAKTGEKDATDFSRHGPAVTRIAQEYNIAETLPQTGSGRGGRLTKGDVLNHIEGLPGADGPSEATPPVPAAPSKDILSTPTDKGLRREWKEPMSMLRRRVAERLLAAQENAAILTTFNEIDMTTVLKLRQEYKEKFKERHGVGLGFMGFFIKAACEGLKDFPKINGWIEGTDIVYHDFVDVGVAVSTEKGLIVPVIRDAHTLSLPEIEKAILMYAQKARDGKISLDDLSGGTFTVSNGGIFGSLMSTPILNPPQSGILGMHKIQERPVAVNGQVVVRPMMYIALSYDHRIVDGKEAVQFLVKVKENIEDPTRLLLGV